MEVHSTPGLDAGWYVPGTMAGDPLEIQGTRFWQIQKKLVVSALT